MRFVILLIFLFVAWLVLPMLAAAGYFDLAIPDAEPGGYSLLEQMDCEEELFVSGVGAWITGLSASRTARAEFHHRSCPLPPVLPPPKST
jgi:hypothetical protein